MLGIHGKDKVVCRKGTAYHKAATYYLALLKGKEAEMPEGFVLAQPQL